MSNKRHFNEAGDNFCDEQPRNKHQKVWPPPPPFTSGSRPRPPSRPPPGAPPLSLPPRVPPPKIPPPSLPHHTRIAPPLLVPPPSRLPPLEPSCPSEAGPKISEQPKPLLRPKGGLGIAIKLSKPVSSKPAVEERPKKPSVAAVFNAEDSSDEEEMPIEAKMRMRNVGRETITSAGPNSFGKTKQGFTDTNKLYEKQLKEAMEKVANKDRRA